MLSQTMKQIIGKIDIEFIHNIFIVGKKIIETIHELFRYLQPKNMSTIWLLLLNNIKEINNLWILLKEIKNDDNNNNNIILELQNFYISLSYMTLIYIEIIIFLLTHTNQRSISNKYVFTTI